MTASAAHHSPSGSVLRVERRGAAVLVLVSLAGLMMFLWPLLVTPPSGLAHDRDAPLLFVALLPALVAVVLSEVTAGRMNTKSIAMLGVLSAIGAALRPMGVGTAGIETVFFLLVLAGRVYGPGFGFVLGSTTLFASGLITGGIGPWLPFQMLAASWVGLGAGMLPAWRGRAEIALLALYGAIAAYAFGFLLNMWFWPFVGGTDTRISFVAGDAVLTNLHRFVLFTFATSTGGWDTGRAITNVVAIIVIGPAMLLTFRRAARRASFDAVATFGSGEAIATPTR
ncbi:MAG: ECF transporter S component [Acidimicrobiales bacterium]